MIRPQRKFMQEAIREAKQAYKKGDYAVGAVVVKNNRILSRGGQRVKLNQDPTGHAEIVAIRRAAKKLKTRHLEGCILYTTHEPCPMCAAACVWAKMKGVVSGARMEDMIEHRRNHGNADWDWRTIDVPAKTVLKKGEPKLFIVEEFMRKECKNLFHS